MLHHARGLGAGAGRIHISVIAPSFLGLLMLCQGCESHAPAFTVADSAGVAIVESRRPLWERGSGWILSREPEVAIGQREGDERYLLSEVAGVRRLSDGRIAILDAGSYRVRVYDSAGVHLMDLGGEGDGPSEFRWPQFLGAISDTLFVYEYVGGDLTWFSPQGQLLRTSSVLPPGDGGARTPVMFGCLEDRLGVGVSTPGSRSRSLVEGLNRESWSIWRLDLVNAGLDSLVSVPGDEAMVLSSGPRGTQYQAYVFGKSTVLAASTKWLYVAPTDAYSIQVLDREGVLRRIIRRDEPPRRVSRSDLNRWVDRAIEVRGDSPEERASMRQTAGELHVAETLPAFRWIAVDSEDNLWVEQWEGAGWDQGAFSVFRSDGAWLGNVAIPRGLPLTRGDYGRQVIEIGADYLLGVWTDDLGVEQVRLYRINKAESP